MAYGGVNPVDRYEALGRVAPDAALPRTLGSEGAGTIEGGSRRVFVSRDAVVRDGDGLWATHVLARADRLIDVPDGVGLDVAAAMGVAGVTAWRCVVDLAQVGPDDRVLVLGASGGVGSVIVSLAHRSGAEVVAQTGSATKREFLEQRGADRVVVTEAGGLVAALEQWSPTAVLDPLGDGFTGAAIEALAPRGRLVLYGTSADTVGTIPLQALYRKALSLLGYAGLIEPAERVAEGVRAGLEAVRAGKMEIVVDSVVPLEKVNASFERIVDRKVLGKQLLDLQAKA